MPVIMGKQALSSVSFVDELLRSTGGHEIAMAWSGAMAKSRRPESSKDAPRRGYARAAGELVGDIAGTTFKRFGFVQGAVVSRWAEIVGERYAKVSTPESIRFPAGRKSDGTLTLSVEGAHAPLMQHLAPLIIERVNRFFGYAGDRQDRVSPGAAGQGQRRRSCGPPRRRFRSSSAKAFARSPIPSFAPASNRWPASLPDRAGRRPSSQNPTTEIPVISRSK